MYFQLKTMDYFFLLPLSGPELEDVNSLKKHIMGVGTGLRDCELRVF